MATYFADTSFWIALSNRRDQYHARALAWSQYFLRAQAAILTTEAVLWEWMNALADVATRRTAAEGYWRLHRDPNVDVAPFRAATDARPHHGSPFPAGRVRAADTRAAARILTFPMPKGPGKVLL